MKNNSKNLKQPALASELMKAVALKAPVRSKIEKDFSPEEVNEIQQKLAEKKKARIQEEKEQSEEARARRERIVRIKKMAKEMEKGNQEKVIIFPSYSRKSDKLEWYKMGDFSALYYVYRMADRMGRRARLLKDTDKFAKMGGVASVKDVESFLKKAMLLNEFEKYEKTLEGFYILYLKKPLTDEEVGILRRTERERREMMHNVLRPKKADAAVYQSILMIDRQVLPRTSNMPKGYYVTIGEAMARHIMYMTRIYFNYADGMIDVSEAKTRMLDLINSVRAGAVILGENGIWGYDIASSIGENINTLKKLVEAMK